MAQNIYTNVSGDWTAVANWSLGAAPIAADTPAFLTGTSTIDTNVPGAAAGVNYAGLIVGPGWAGKIGSTSNKLYLGTVVADLIFDGANCQECWLVSDAADSNSIDVYSTSLNPYSLVLYGGTWDVIRVHGSRALRIGASATATALYMIGQSTVATIESGATVTAAYQTGGSVYNSAAATTVTMSGGTWHHVGPAAFNITPLNLYGNARFVFSSQGGTITTINMYSPDCVVDCTANCYARTITTLNRYGGLLDVSGTSGSVTIVTENAYGGTKRLVGGGGGGPVA
jgi:hypothetical protein